MQGLVIFAIALLALAMQQDQTPRHSMKVDRVFYELAASTGGDIYFWAPGEFASSCLQVPVHHEHVVFAYGSVDTKRVFDIPIESGAKSMTLFAGVERKDLAVLVRPDGTVQRDGIQSFQRMAIGTVLSPPPGLWRLELQGSGLYAVTAHVDPGPDGFQLIDVRFVEPGGRPGHEGMFPIKRPVKAGEKLACSITVSGPAKDVRLIFVGSDGRLLTSTDAERVSDDEYAAACVVQTVAQFRHPQRARRSRHAPPQAIRDAGVPPRRRSRGPEPRQGALRRRRARNARDLGKAGTPEVACGCSTSTFCCTRSMRTARNTVARAGGSRA